MPRLVWSVEALADVQRLYRFLAITNPTAARRAISIIRQTVQIIADHPEIGRPVDNMPLEYRDWPIAFASSGYVARYYYDGAQAVLIAIRHQKEVGYQSR
jgi:plasmid stabilization system protein ParE